MKSSIFQLIIFITHRSSREGEAMVASVRPSVRSTILIVSTLSFEPSDL